MTPKAVDPPTQPNSKNDVKEYNENGSKSQALNKEENKLKIFQYTSNLIAHVLILTVVITTLTYAISSGMSPGATQTHIILCVVGYQLLMAEAVLSLTPHNFWSRRLKLVAKRRAHWMLQSLGSGLAIAGSLIKIIDKSVHWNSMHGKFAIVALIFTVFSLINGLTSLWAFEIRKFIPGNFSKLTHICFGTVAFCTSSIALCYAFDKNMFRFWLSSEISYTLISFTAIFTTIIIINPIITFYKKRKNFG